MNAVFSDNPRRQAFAMSDHELAELCTQSVARFLELPLLHQGASSEIRRTTVPGILVQRLIPSLNSISRQRRGHVEGTQRLRREISQIFWTRLHRDNVATCHLACKDEYVLLSEESIPPVEVIVKAALIGTPARIYHGIFEHTDRFGRRIVKHEAHEPYVRFDYRNPLRDGVSAVLRDECMPPALADRFIDTQQAERSALRVFDVIQRTLGRVDLVLLDACFLFDETGRVLCYEVSPDNMRIKRVNWARDPQPTDEFDKDLWRDGANTELLVRQWHTLKTHLERFDD